jgi:hypothetical protein
MSKVPHVRICKGVGVRFPGATLLLISHHEKAARLLSCHGTIFFFVCSNVIPPYSLLQRVVSHNKLRLII